MTKAQRADALLEAARRWQNGHPSVIGTLGMWAREYYDPHDTNSSFDGRNQERRDESASAALSEAAGLGFDIVDAKTGEPAEKVAFLCNCPNCSVSQNPVLWWKVKEGEKP